jgi:hypothetical protein
MLIGIAHIARVQPRNPEQADIFLPGLIVTAHATYAEVVQAILSHKETA